MLTVIIPTLNCEDLLGPLLRQLDQAPIRVVVSDGMSEDGTLKLAAINQVNIAIGEKGRGQQLRRGAHLASLKSDMSDWYLFLHADSVLSENWYERVEVHIQNHPQKAGFFRLKYDSHRIVARWVELMTAWRSMTTSFPKGWALPYGDQGLLISNGHYQEIGGYPDWPLFEDVKIIEKIGSQRLRHLGASITTSAAKYERDGFLKRGWRNFRLLRRYKKGEPIEELVKAYQ